MPYGRMRIVDIKLLCEVVALFDSDTLKNPRDEKSNVF